MKLDEFFSNILGGHIHVLVSYLSNINEQAEKKAPDTQREANIQLMFLYKDAPVFHDCGYLKNEDLSEALGGGFTKNIVGKNPKNVMPDRMQAFKCLRPVEKNSPVWVHYNYEKESGDVDSLTLSHMPSNTNRCN